MKPNRYGDDWLAFVLTVVAALIALIIVTAVQP